MKRWHYKTVDGDGVVREGVLQGPWESVLLKILINGRTLVYAKEIDRDEFNTLAKIIGYKGREDLKSIPAATKPKEDVATAKLSNLEWLGAIVLLLILIGWISSSR